MQWRSLLILFSFSLVIPITMIGCGSTVDSPSQVNLTQPNSGVSIPVTLKGTALVGATLTATDEHDRPITLKIVAIEPDASDRDLYLYTVLHRNAHNAQWQNLCQPDSAGSVKAIPLSGQWDKTGAHLDNGQITFACTNDVRAKCVRLGYKPWKTVNEQSLRPYHQACTRMLRADYCGNGIAHTQEGTPINIGDRLKIQTLTPDSGMAFEAAWSPQGAVFLSRTRYPETLKQLQQECPEKLQTMLRSQPRVTTLLDDQASNALMLNQSFAK